VSRTAGAATEIPCLTKEFMLDPPSKPGPGRLRRPAGEPLPRAHYWGGSVTYSDAGAGYHMLASFGPMIDCEDDG
jgi:hypothetical protein